MGTSHKRTGIFFAAFAGIALAVAMFAFPQFALAETTAPSAEPTLATQAPEAASDQNAKVTPTDADATTPGNEAKSATDGTPIIDGTVDASTVPDNGTSNANTAPDANGTVDPSGDPNDSTDPDGTPAEEPIPPLKNKDNDQVVKHRGVFDAEYYLANNPDVLAAFGRDALAALNHFLKYGIAEGRLGNATFDLESYYNANQDLRIAFNTNLTKYYTHYVDYGQKEGRTYAGVATLQNYRTSIDGTDYAAAYDGAYYHANHSDLDAAFTKTVSGYTLFDDTALLRHFLNYGMKEGRASSENFEVLSYYNANQDLRAAFGTNLKSYYIHYVKYGEKEGRAATGVATLQDYRTSMDGVDYAAVYDPTYYRSNNDDLDAAFTKTTGGYTLFDDTALLRHFIKYGSQEGRTANSTFDVFSYYFEYPDLRAAFQTSLIKYYQHYCKFGQAEGRNNSGTTSLVGYVTTWAGLDWNLVYDPEYYMQNSTDVTNYYTKTVGGRTLLDDAGVMGHFYNYGMNEGRRGNTTFDVRSYFLEYQDVRVSAHGYYQGCYRHYVKYGYNEGRHASGCTKLKANGNPQNLIVQYCKNTPSPGRNLCSEWVAMVFQKLGLRDVQGDACDDYWWFCKSSNRNELKVGMLIAVPSHSHSYMGGIYGHVCIYIGNGQVMDNVGRIRTYSLNKWLSYYGTTYTPKWGWYDNISLV